VEKFAASFGKEIKIMKTGKMLAVSPVLMRLLLVPAMLLVVGLGLAQTADIPPVTPP